MRTKYIVHLTIVIFLAVIMTCVYALVVNHNLHEIPTHEVRYELSSKEGLIGIFYWDEPGFSCPQQQRKQFIRGVKYTTGSFMIHTEIKKLPFTINTHGDFSNPVTIEIYYDDKLVEKIENTCFFGIELLCEDIRRPNN